MHIYQKSTRLFAAAICSALLVACGGGEDAADVVEDAAAVVEETVEETVEEITEVSTTSAQALVDQCVAEGETEELCSCQVGVVEEVLGEEDFSKLIDFAQNDDEAAAQAMMTEIMTDKPEVAVQMGTKMAACAG